MAVETIRKSDVSGTEIPQGTGARIRVVFFADDRVDMRADLTDEEVAELLPWARPVEQRPERRQQREARAAQLRASTDHLP